MPIVVSDIAAVIVTVIAVFTVVAGTAVVDVVVAVFERDRFFILLHPL